jgi:hypothetical protein
MQTKSTVLTFIVLLILLAACGTVSIKFDVTPQPDNVSATITTRAIEYAALKAQKETLEASTGTVAMPPPTITISPSVYPTPTIASPTELARAYLDAVLADDRRSARALIKLDPWCSPAPTELEETLDEHLALYGSTQVRNIDIKEQDVSGWVIFPPGAKAACISFESLGAQSPDWRSASVCIIVVNEGICDLK